MRSRHISFIDFLMKESFMRKDVDKKAWCSNANHWKFFLPHLSETGCTKPVTDRLNPEFPLASWMYVTFGGYYDGGNLEYNSKIQESNFLIKVGFSILIGRKDPMYERSCKEWMIWYSFCMGEFARKQNRNIEMHRKRNQQNIPYRLPMDRMLEMYHIGISKAF